MNRIPYFLIYSRLVMGLFIGILALVNSTFTPQFIVFLMGLGLLSDILDGIIARKLGVATEKLRVWDSNADQFFWIIVICSVFTLNRAYVISNYFPILIILLLELAAYVLSYLRFRKPIATHSYLAKGWTLTMFAFLTDLTLHGSSHHWFMICAITGIVSRVEIIGIIAFLDQWTTDVPSLLSVRGINRRGMKKNRDIF